jgi:luciferase family oxidoreductase group 1
LAARRGVPFVYAAHFAPDYMNEALAIYRDEFIPSEALEAPYVTVCINATVAETQEEAERLATTEYQKFLGLIRGRRFLLPPPVESMERIWTPHEAATVGNMLSESIHGEPDLVQHKVANLVGRTGADEILVNSWIFDQTARVKSYELLYKAVNS